MPRTVTLVAPPRRESFFMTRLLLVSDPGFCGDALLQRLTAESRFVVERSLDVAAAIRALKDSRFELVLVDATMPDSVDVVLNLAASGTDARIAALGACADDALRWARAGASGYVSRSTPLDELSERVRALLRGELECPSSVVAKLFQTVARIGAQGLSELPDLFSPREKEVAQLVAMELTNKEIAERLFISETTVKCHVKSCCRKLGVNSRHRLGRWWRSQRTAAPTEPECER